METTTTFKWRERDHITGQVVDREIPTNGVEYSKPEKTVETGRTVWATYITKGHADRIGQKITAYTRYRCCLNALYYGSHGIGERHINDF